MITQSELIGISTWTKPVLHTKILGKKFDACMTFRRNIQVAMTEYARHHKTDPVQLGALQVTGWIESWCRDAYFKMRMPELLRQVPGLLLKPKKAAKGMIRAEWSKYATKAGY